MADIGVKFRCTLAGLAVFAISAGIARADADRSVSITLLHTNDLHSHFRPEKTPLALGGLGRIKTEVDRIRSTTPNTLLLDAGDWSEGDIYYSEGAGAESLKMMDMIGYDIAVVGNHDWLNGPDSLMAAIRAANPKMALVGANFDSSTYERGSEFRTRIPPFVVRKIGEAKIAFIGLATYEFIYDKYMDPIKILEPFDITRDLARKLKTVVDSVVVISHNDIDYNKLVLQNAPDVDLVIGAHDHVKLTKPIVIERKNAAPGWLVETGCWGKNLGRVDMSITPRTATEAPKVVLKKYGLIQMDRTIPEDPQIVAKIAEIEQSIENRVGPVFTDHVGDNQMELTRDGFESPLGDFITDAYREATGADLALDVKNFVYAPIHVGQVNSVDVYNSNPAVYNPKTGKNWTLKVLPIQGKTLTWLFKLFLYKKLPLAGRLYSSGSNVHFEGALEPTLPEVPGHTVQIQNLPSLFGLTEATGWTPEAIVDSATQQIDEVLIGGKPLDENRMYKMAGNGGVFEAIGLVNALMPGLISTDGLWDTGIESWRASVDYARTITPISRDKLAFGDRFVSHQPNLGVYDDDITWTVLSTKGDKVAAEIQVRVKNYGGSPSPGGVLMIGKNHNGNNWAIDTDFEKFADPIQIAPLAPGESRTYRVLATLSPDRGVYSVIAMIRDNSFDADHANDDVIHYFTYPQN